MANRFQYRTVSFAEARLNDGQRLLAFNDLFIGAASHVSARYRISYEKNSEEHSSSGIIVSTKSGSTGWLSSIFNMAYGLQGFAESIPKKVRHLQPGDEELIFAVREPFASKKTQTSIQAGVIRHQNKLIIESYMPANGVIFSDGVENDFLKFNSGSIAAIGVAKEKGKLVTG